VRLPAARIRKRADALRGLAAPCVLCPNACRVDRREGEVGRCGVGWAPRIAGSGAHFGEEACLVGRAGSGTVFFAGCNLSCVFCQNWEISQRRDGRDVSVRALAEVFLEIEAAGCPNLNLVTPTPHAAAIVEALALAAERGFDSTVVWNCGGYESVDVLRQLDGIVDIYMPDVKYGDDATGEWCSGVAGYATAARAALREMHRQVGDLRLDDDGIARRGVLVRHLVLPGGLAGTGSVAAFLAAVSTRTAVNVMDQYHPCYRAHERPPLDRRVRPDEVAAARAAMRRAGMRWRIGGGIE